MAMYASTSLSIWLVASDRPIEIDTPVLPKEAASDAAAAVAVISEVSLAPMETLGAMMPAVEVPPSSYASTVSAISFSTYTPEPLTPTLVPPEDAATATDPAAVVAMIVSLAVAVMV